MNEETTITTEDFQKYRRGLGFSNQADVKSFFGAKDVVPTVDLKYLELLNERLREIVDRVNDVVNEEIKLEDADVFGKEYIDTAFKTIQESGILPRLNNQGRRPEEVYFSWMRGYVMANFFQKAIGLVFGIDLSKIDLIGDDDLRDPDTFKRAPTADLEITLPKGEKLRIEMQSGFQGVNDIKEHKVREAKKIASEQKIGTLAVHLDLFNGQVAFVRLDTISDSDVNWITRQQMEGQTVFEINQNHFVWKIVDKPVSYKSIQFD